MIQYNHLVGQRIVLGNYVQESESKEPVGWTVLAAKGSMLLLCTEAIIESMCWDEDAEWSGCQWNDSFIYQCLNGEFFHELFSETERLVVEASDSLSEKDEDEGGLFLLSEEQLDQYALLLFGPLKGYQTAYVKKNSSSDFCWLRSDYRDLRHAFCYSMKEKGLTIEEVDKFENLGIRPAMWIDADILEEFLPEVLREFKDL